MVESNNLAVTYLKQIRQWMDEHPSEVVIMWVSRHGSVCDTEFPDTPESAMQVRCPPAPLCILLCLFLCCATPDHAIVCVVRVRVYVCVVVCQEFYGNLTSIFQGLLFDHSESTLNETTISTLVQRNHRMVLYVSDYYKFTGNTSSLSMNGCTIDNRLLGCFPESQYIPQLVHREMWSAPRRALDKANNALLLQSLSGGATHTSTQYVSEIAFVLPFCFAVPLLCFSLSVSFLSWLCLRLVSASTRRAPAFTLTCFCCRAPLLWQACCVVEVRALVGFQNGADRLCQELWVSQHDRLVPNVAASQLTVGKLL